MVYQEFYAIADSTRSKALAIDTLPIAVLPQTTPGHQYLSVIQCRHIGVTLNTTLLGVNANGPRKKVPLPVQEPCIHVGSSAWSGFPSDNRTAIGGQCYARVGVVGSRIVLANHHRGTDTGKIRIQPLQENSFALAGGRGVLPDNESPATIDGHCGVLLVAGHIAHDRIFAAQRRQSAFGKQYPQIQHGHSRTHCNSPHTSSLVMPGIPDGRLFY